ncbi:exosortase family protein XrtF [Polaribacter sp. Z014]|uniref:exosortase family protein XrtF n=1 Tax=unclassified Polaribacter TaxID=196858 RepID=UPI00193B888C|nr:exosortase family protein XrtF [Polaribacter sp. Q13]MCL7765093.1 exosortase family protein XrtF [Polaribacter sp. Z014]QVY64953.1 exosortase family protein XrtF [Polaribacter sp. Q13]
MKKHKSIIIFLIKFFVTYFLLVTIYNSYLQHSQKKEGIYKTASITTAVANQTVKVLTFLGYHVDAVQHDKEVSVKLIIEGKYTARVIEGCNSISLIILFISFIIAFSGSFKATFLFAVFGSVFIYIVNVLRIAFLTVMIYKYPHKVGFLHDLVFPAIIYGAVFLLWVVWVNKFSNFKR